MELDVQWLGRRAYTPVWELQKQLLERRIAGEIGDTLLLVEHEPVYTWGKRTDPAHLGPGPEGLRALGADTFEVERGGEVTYHGPGQLTGYPIVNLANLRCGRDLHKYMRGLEEVMIKVLAGYGLRSERVQGLTGVWIQEAGGSKQDAGKVAADAADPDCRIHSPKSSKVAALGVRVRKWCTMHGFALNVSNDCLPWFRHIVPCGIEGRGVTSIEAMLGRAPSMPELRERLVAAFKDVFAR
ncbi:MAG: lipoyl(octanoyl) transferase LipB [Planctomycetes bacterium]|nr:lipoyl(octanoyl) transferase LipB [Planctomycetota bacterium]